MNDPEIYWKHAFVNEHEALFLYLKNHVEWDERMQARKTASYGVAYNYSQISYVATSMPVILQTLCVAIEGDLGFLPNNCLLNFYPDGSSSMGFHSDSTEELAPATGVAIISLGSLRHIAFRNKAERNLEFRYPLLAGSLLYLSDEIQQTWLHAIPKEPEAGERISLTFRKINT
jgi:alkylated DNA repair dioxygenase AlkB